MPKVEKVAPAPPAPNVNYGDPEYWNRFEKLFRQMEEE
jgi:hypothetical protein